MDINAFTIATEGIVIIANSDTPASELQMDGNEIELLFVEDA